MGVGEGQWLQQHPKAVAQPCSALPSCGNLPTTMGHRKPLGGFGGKQGGFGEHPCIDANSLSLRMLSTCGWSPSQGHNWSLDASQVKPLPAFQAQAAGTQISAHPKKLPHTLQLAEALVLRHQRNRDSGKTLLCHGLQWRGNPCYRPKWLPQKLGSFVCPWPLHPHSN